MSAKLHISVFGNPASDFQVVERIAGLFTLLAGCSSVIDIEKDFYDSLSGKIAFPTMARRVTHADAASDLIISVGGDGTFLRAVSWQGDAGVPVAGLNGGHLGYLAGWTLEEIPEFVRALSSGSYRVEQRTLIKVESEADILPATEWLYALNEVAVLKESSATMILVSAEIDGRFLADYDGDGLIVATPTGSTGYNLSVGGPILEPQLQAWAVSPVAPHSLNMRPLVVSDCSVLRLVAHARTGHVLLCLDGRSISIPGNMAVILRRADFCIPVVRPESTTFSDTLREKLYWGIGSDNR